MPPDQNEPRMREATRNLISDSLISYPLEHAMTIGETSSNAPIGSMTARARYISRPTPAPILRDEDTRRLSDDEVCALWKAGAYRLST